MATPEATALEQDIAAVGRLLDGSDKRRKAYARIVATARRLSSLEVRREGGGGEEESGDTMLDRIEAAYRSGGYGTEDVITLARPYFDYVLSAARRLSDPPTEPERDAAWWRRTFDDYQAKTEAIIGQLRQQLRQAVSQRSEATPPRSEMVRDAKQFCDDWMESGMDHSLAVAALIGLLMHHRSPASPAAPELTEEDQRDHEEFAEFRSAATRGAKDLLRGRRTHAPAASETAPTLDDEAAEYFRKGFEAGQRDADLARSSVPETSWLDEDAGLRIPSTGEPFPLTWRQLARNWRDHGTKPPLPPEATSEDTKRLDWLDRGAYATMDGGRERWTARVLVPHGVSAETLREAIDSAMSAPTPKAEVVNSTQSADAARSTEGRAQFIQQRDDVTKGETR